MIVLALSTSTPRGSAAILGEGISCCRGYEDLYGHAERLLGIVDAVLQESGIERSQIGALACDVGPGSFTGVRVGVATAKGIALALDRPVVGVGSLEAMAAAAWSELAGDEAVQQVIPLLDARKGEVFAARYDREMREIRPPEHVDRDRVTEVLNAECLQRTRVVGRIARELELSSESLALWPDARWIAERAALVLAQGEAPDAEEVVPVYVRAPDAKLPTGAKVS